MDTQQPHAAPRRAPGVPHLRGPSRWYCHAVREATGFRARCNTDAAREAQRLRREEVARRYTRRPRGAGSHDDGGAGGPADEATATASPLAASAGRGSQIPSSAASNAAGAQHGEGDLSAFRAFHSDPERSGAADDATAASRASGSDDAQRRETMPPSMARAALGGGGGLAGREGDSMASPEAEALLLLTNADLVQSGRTTSVSAVADLARTHATPPAYSTNASPRAGDQPPGSSSMSPLPPPLRTGTVPALDIDPKYSPEPPHGRGHHARTRSWTPVGPDEELDAEVRDSTAPRGRPTLDEDVVVSALTSAAPSPSAGSGRSPHRARPRSQPSPHQAAPERPAAPTRHDQLHAAGSNGCPRAANAQRTERQRRQERERRAEALATLRAAKERALRCTELVSRSRGRSASPNSRGASPTAPLILVDALQQQARGAPVQLLSDGTLLVAGGSRSASAGDAAGGSQGGARGLEQLMRDAATDAARSRQSICIVSPDSARSRTGSLRSPPSRSRSGSTAMRLSRMPSSAPAEADSAPSSGRIDGRRTTHRHRMSADASRAVSLGAARDVAANATRRASLGLAPPHPTRGAPPPPPRWSGAAVSYDDHATGSVAAASQSPHNARGSRRGSMSRSTSPQPLQLAHHHHSARTSRSASEALHDPETHAATFHRPHLAPVVRTSNLGRHGETEAPGGHRKRSPPAPPRVGNAEAQSGADRSRPAAATAATAAGGHSAQRTPEEPQLRQQSGTSSAPSSPRMQWEITF